MSPVRVFGIAALFIALPLTAYDQPEETTSAPSKRQYTYTWQFLEGDDMAPRGGTTKGPSIDLVTAPGDAWQSLQEPGVSKFERDRRAILAMAGPYRTSFDFIETVGFTEGYTPGKPYQSWGTEYVYVVTDEPEFISLQHVLVMRIEMEDGSISEPMVVKHWRQDWRYQQRDLHTYRGHQTWERDRRNRRDVRGQWTQSVYQVDDSPRYMASGEWEHYANYSSWTSEDTWRPLPRREFSVRDDYHVLVGTNRHTISPTGWVQEEHNLKVVLDDNGERVAVLARENGLARYERIANYDWTAGNEYWSRTGPFWAEVRDYWEELFESEKRVEISKSAEGKPLFMAMFELADSTTAANFDSDAARKELESAMQPYLDSAGN